MRDEEIVELFFRRDEKAIDETDKKYGNYCQAIANNILGNRQDVDECLDDTYGQKNRCEAHTRTSSGKNVQEHDCRRDELILIDNYRISI